MRSPALVTIASMSRLRWRPTCELRGQGVPGHVADHEPAARLENARHLVDGGLGIGEVVKRSRTDERGEAGVLEGQRVARCLDELDVPKLLHVAGRTQA